MRRVPAAGLRPGAAISCGARWPACRARRAVAAAGGRFSRQAEAVRAPRASGWRRSRHRDCRPPRVPCWSVASSAPGRPDRPACRRLGAARIFNVSSRAARRSRRRGARAAALLGSQQQLLAALLRQRAGVAEQVRRQLAGRAASERRPHDASRKPPVAPISTRLSASEPKRARATSHPARPGLSACRHGHRS